MATEAEHARWLAGLVRARLWYCGDDHCDCTEPIIERVTPNLRLGYPAVHREALWVGRFLTDTGDYTEAEREELQYGPWRRACADFGVAVPDGYEEPPPGCEGVASAVII